MEQKSEKENQETMQQENPSQDNDNSILKTPKKEASEANKEPAPPLTDKIVEPVNGKSAGTMTPEKPLRPVRASRSASKRNSGKKGSEIGSKVIKKSQQKNKKSSQKNGIRYLLIHM